MPTMGRLTERELLKRQIGLGCQAFDFMCANAASGQLKKPRIILLEDSRLLTEILRFCIADWFRNPELVVFENGDAAWAELTRWAPDLLITDRIHPGLDGDEMLWRLAGRQIKFPILMLSSDVAPRADLPPDLNVVCLPKPFNRDILWRVLDKLIGPCDFSDQKPATHQSSPTPFDPPRARGC